MEVLVILVPLALGLGLVGLLGFLWSLKSGQYDDLEGAAWRAIADDEPRSGEAGILNVSIERATTRRVRTGQPNQRQDAQQQFE